MPPEIPSHRSSSTTSSHFAIDDSDYQEPNPPNPEAVAAERRRTRNRTIILAVSSAILVATIVFITSSGVFYSSEDDVVHRPPATPPNNIDDWFNMSSVQSKIQAFCQLTDFQSTCVSSISEEVAGLNSNDPLEFLVALVSTSIVAARKAYNYTAKLYKSALDGPSRWAVEDCHELLQYAMLELQICKADIRSIKLCEMQKNMADLMTSLSAAVTYQQTCVDGFSVRAGGGNRTVEMESILPLSDLAKQTRNCLAIASRIWTDLGLTAGRSSGKMMAEVGSHVWQMARGKVDVVVAEDGSGDYKTIAEALKVATKERNGRFVIYVKEGVYKESVKVTDEMKYITMCGDGPHKTVVTGSEAFGDGMSTYRTATFAVSGIAFMARDMGFENTAGPEKAQAVALRVESDLSVFYNCWIHGYQNTLLAHTHRQFYRDCTISGTIDLISGDAAAVFQNCDIVVKKPLVGQKNTITAQARIDHYQPTGFILQNCTISAAPELYPLRGQIPTYLGRPMKERSRVVIMQSTIDDLIGPKGWGPAGGEGEWEKSVYFAEFGNSGSGSSLEGRVTWQGFHKLVDKENALAFTAGEFIQGKRWLNMTGAPFSTGLL